jgi:short-subunit dehydrogenase
LAQGRKLGLHDRYGGYALVTGGARGIGRAFAEHLAAEGFDLLLVDREEEETLALAEELHASHGIDAQAIVCDLSENGLAEKAAEWAKKYDIGLLINNAGISPMDPFFDISLEAHLTTLDLNCRATLILTHTIGRDMTTRGRGAVIIVSSASAISGAPYFTHYTATKGYGLNLGASLWSELRGSGVDVLAVCPGLTNTAPIKELGLDQGVPFFIPRNDPELVARGALRALGRQPVVVPTFADRLMTSVMSRLLPRSWTLSLVRRSMKQLRGSKKTP